MLLLDSEQTGEEAVDQEMDRGIDEGMDRTMDQTKTLEMRLGLCLYFLTGYKINLNPGFMALIPPCSF